MICEKYQALICGTKLKNNVTSTAVLNDDNNAFDIFNE